MSRTISSVPAEDRRAGLDDAAQVVRAVYAIVSGEDASPLSRYVADDVVAEVPGDSPNAGRYEGFAAFAGFLRRAAEVTNGTLRAKVHDVAVGEGCAIALATYTAERPGRAPLENHLCHLVRVVDGKIVYSRFFTGDQYAVDAFWRDAHAGPASPASPAKEVA